MTLTDRVYLPQNYRMVLEIHHDVALRCQQNLNSDGTEVLRRTAIRRCVRPRWTASMIGLAIS